MATAADHNAGLSQPMAALAVRSRPPPGLPEAADIAIDSSDTEVEDEVVGDHCTKELLPLLEA